MKRILKGTLLLAIAALSIFGIMVPVMAQTPPPTPAIASVAGTISAINSGATPPTVTIHPKTGADVTLNVVATTAITKAGIGKATLADLAVNDRAGARYNPTTLEAIRIAVVRPIAKHHLLSGVIKSLASNSFVLTTRNNGDVTIIVNDQTRFQVFGNKTAKLSDLVIGDRLAVTEVQTAEGNLAKLVRLMPVSLAGQIKSIDLTGKTFVLTTKNRGDVTITVDSQTRFRIFGDASARLDDLKVSERVTVRAFETSGGNLAQLVTLLPVSLAGQIKSVDVAGKTFVLTTKNHGDVTVKVTSQTRFRISGDKDGRLDDLKVGDRVTVRAFETTDGNLAQLVTLLPVSLAGQIKSIDLAGKAFVLTTKNQGDVTIKVNDQTRLRTQGNKSAGLDDLKVGGHAVVTVAMTTDSNLALLVRIVGK